MSKGVLYIVHRVDTEGPLYEPLEVTGERINQVFGYKCNLDASKLEELQQGIGAPEDIRESLIDFLSPERLKYNTSWFEVDEMLDEIMSEAWRMKYADDFGNGYRFNWFVVDHVGFIANPRRRALGYHTIYDHYVEKFKIYGVKDRLHWHFHCTPFFYEANKTSNNFHFSNEHLQVLSRRVIDKLDFPVAYSPGCHTERPDINLFLEQWIPVDYGNQGMPESPEDAMQKDLSGGRYGDWRRATSNWEVYHPDFYDYQKKGTMKRYIARCLNIGSRVRRITREEIEKAFERAASGKSTILSITDHDEREMRGHIHEFMHLIREVQEKFAGVKIAHADAVEAVRSVEGIEREEPTKLDIGLGNKRIEIRADKEIWGPQPYFCFQTKDNRYIHENLDYHGDRFWSYVFDDETINLESIRAIGVATNDNYFNTSVYRLNLSDPSSNSIDRRNK